VSTLVAEPPTSTPAPTLAGYQLRLPTFEGPLDVLLRLVERNQLPIADVSLAAVAEQFLDYVAGLGGAPPEAIAEFAAVGARLVLIKSRSLLPRPPEVDASEPDPSELVRQLTEYQRIQAAARHLAERDRIGAGAFAQGGGVALPLPVALAPLAAHQPATLVRAIRRRLSVVAPPVRLLVNRPVVSLREMIERVLDRLTSAHSVRFHELSAGTDRQETMTAFLAVLVLIRRRVLDAEQSTTFGEITLRPAAESDTPTRTKTPDDDEFAADD
jgi:segregation and condensation protein A